MERLAYLDRDFAGSADAAALAAGARPRLARALPRGRRFRRLPLQLGMAALAACGLAAALALLGEARHPSTSDMSLAPPSAPLPAWIEISPADQIFTLDAPEFAKEPRAYEARRHHAGGGRQDALVFGGADGRALRLRLNFYRVGAEAPPEAAFFVDLARRAAEMGRAIARAAQPTALQTRLGAFEAASLSLTGSDGFDAACLGFRSIGATAMLRITGFACDCAADLAAARSRLACLIDRIELAPSADDAELVKLFAARDLSAGGDCAEAQAEPPPARSSRPDISHAAASPRAHRKKR
jgi:hypothetical protein